MTDNLDRKALLSKYQKENLKLKRNIKSLREKNENLKSTQGENTILAGNANSIEGLETFLIRINTEKKVQYVNSAFCMHFIADKDTLIGKPITVLKKIVSKELLKAFECPEENKPKSLNIKDPNGNVYDIKNSLHNGIQDIVIQDVSNEHQLKNYISQYISSDLTKLSEEDLNTFKYPERRFMSVSFTDMRGFTKLTEALEPEEVRATMNDYLESVIQAIDKNGATIDKIVGDEVMALYGAPRYYSDHALRSIKTACEQMLNLKALRENFKKIGKTMPKCGIGINSGEMVVGNMGSTTRQDYTVLGSSVNLAARLCSAAKGNEVLVSEMTMNAALQSIPKNWQIKKLKTKKIVDLKTLRGKTEAIHELPKNLLGIAYIIGPHVKEDKKTAEYRFQYLYQLKAKGISELLPVLSVSAPQQKSSLELSTIAINNEKRERIFGKFRLQELIGKGGMGEVWKAKDTFGKFVAIKMLLAGEGASEQSLKRFRREAEIMSKLQHRNICRINEVGIIDKVTYISMEYVDGVSLSELLKSTDPETNSDHSFSDTEVKIESFVASVSEKKSDSGSSHDTKSFEEDSEINTSDARYLILPKSQTLSIIGKVAEGIQHAHENGILHRDLKPANIMIRNNGEPVVMDFGLAKMDNATNTEEGMSLSISGQIVGTIEYMSPEQAHSSKHVNEQADVYSLGAILFQMLTGTRHFKSSGNILSDANKLEHYEPPNASHINKHIDKDLEVITTKSLRPEMNDRYTSVKELHNDIIQYEKGYAISARSVSNLDLLWKLCKRNKAISLVIISAFIVVVSGTILSFFNMNLEKNEALKSQKKAELERRKASQARARAVDNLQKIKDTAPDFINYANILIDEYNFDEALIEIDTALSLNSESDYYWQLKGNMHETLLDFSKAHAAYKKALEINPTNNSANDSYALYSELIKKKKTFSDLSVIELNRIISLMVKQKRNPESVKYAIHIENKNKINLEKVKDKLKNSRFKNIPYKLKLTNDGLISLDFGDKEINNIEDLQGLPINQLIVKSNSIDNISPLKDMPLIQLRLNYFKVSDLSVLKNMPLKHLQLNDCSNVSDISSLKGLKLEHFCIPGTLITDISVLKGMPMKRMILNNSIEDISALEGMSLTYLMLRRCGISDISPLKSMPLEYLTLSDTNVENISALEGMPLTYLDIQGTKVKDITALKGMPLNLLRLPSGVSDISPLLGSPINRLTLTSHYIENLDALLGMPLNFISFNNLMNKSQSHIDISALRDSPLETVLLRNCNIIDISCLKGKSLKKLSMYPTKVKDISPLENMNLLNLHLPEETQLEGEWPSIIKNMKLLKSVKVGELSYSLPQFLDHYGLNKNQK